MRTTGVNEQTYARSVLVGGRQQFSPAAHLGDWRVLCSPPLFPSPKHPLSNNKLLNILVIVDDEIGYWNISVDNRGMEKGRNSPSSN